MSSRDQTICAICGHTLAAEEVYCPFDHALEGGVLGLPRVIVEGTPRNHRPLLGVQIGGYRVTGFLGSGGFGAVYRAEQTALRRPVALKILGMEQVLDSSAVERFKREARTAANLLDPNIVTLFDFGQAEIGGVAVSPGEVDPNAHMSPSDSIFGDLAVGHGDRVIYMAMELVEGPTVTQLIQDTGGVTLSAAFTLGTNILRGLAAAHDQDVVHRDLKPSNVVIDAAKRRPYFARLIDFGIASLQDNHTTLRQGAGLLGTPKYMAPEQWDADAPSPATDVYAFGAILVELLTGQSAVPFGDTIRMARAHKTGPRPQVTVTAGGERVSPALTDFITRCLAIAPADRYRNAREALRAFTAISEAEGVIPDPTPTAQSIDPEWTGGELADALVRGIGGSQVDPNGHTASPPAPIEVGDHSGGHWLDGSPHTPAAHFSTPAEADEAPDAGEPAPAEGAGEGWLQDWSSAMSQQSEKLVKHLPGDQKAVALESEPLLDAEFSYGAPDAGDAADVAALDIQHNAAISAPPVAVAPPLELSAVEHVAPAAPQPESAPGPVADSGDDESWGVAGAEMPAGGAQRVDPRTLATAPAQHVIAKTARKPSGPTNLWPIVIGLLVVVAGLVIWRIVAREDAVAESLAESDIKATVNTPIDERPEPAAVASAAPDAAVADAGLAKADSVLILIQTTATFTRATDKSVLCADADTCRVPVDGDVVITKKGYETHTLAADDLFDRKGGRWKLKLRDIQK